MKLSVLIPVYNRAKFLPQLFDSLKKQTYQNFELVIVDDASSDNSIKIIEQELPNFPGAIFIKHDHNQTAPIARNNGLQKATGEYIYLLDADDLLVETAFEKYMQLANEDPALDCITCDELKVNAELKPKRMLLKFTEDYYIKKQNLFRTAFGGAATMLKKDKFFEVGLYDPRMKVSNDRMLSIKLHQKIKTASIPERLYIYREHDANISQNNTSFKTSKEYLKIKEDYYKENFKTEDYINNWQKVKEFKNIDSDYKEERAKKYANVILKCAIHLAKSGNKKQALEELKKAAFTYSKNSYTIFKLFILLGFKNYLDKLYINMNALTNYAYDDFNLINL